MTETERLLEILKVEVRLHPHLTQDDLRKLVFQAVFGGDHLLSDRERFVADLREEWSRLAFEPGRSSDEPVLQVIDPELRTARLHLRPCLRTGITFDWVSSFLASQPPKGGTEERFRRLWSLVGDLVRDDALALSFAISRSGDGSPSPGHHSPQYGDPSYRLVNDLTDPATASWVRETLLDP